VQNPSTPDMQQGVPGSPGSSYATLTKINQALKFSANSLVSLSRSMPEVLQLSNAISAVCDTSVPALRQPSQNSSDKFNLQVEEWKESIRVAVRTYREKNSVSGPDFTPRKIMNNTKDTPRKYLPDLKDGEHGWETSESVTETSYKTGDTESTNKVVDKGNSGDALKALQGKKGEHKLVVVYQETITEDIGGVVSEVNKTKTTTKNLVVGEDRKVQPNLEPERDLKGDLLQQANLLNSELGGLRQTL